MEDDNVKLFWLISSSSSRSIPIWIAWIEWNLSHSNLNIIINVLHQIKIDFSWKCQILRKATSYESARKSPCLNCLVRYLDNSWHIMIKYTVHSPEEIIELIWALLHEKCPRSLIDKGWIVMTCHQPIQRGGFPSLLLAFPNWGLSQVKPAAPGSPLGNVKISQIISESILCEMLWYAVII